MGYSLVGVEVPVFPAALPSGLKSWGNIPATLRHHCPVGAFKVYPPGKGGG